jgi:glucose/arabinose dehydrogenase
VVEYASANGVALPSSARVLLSVEQPYPNHKGGQLAFDRQGYLYVGMGDGGTNPDETFGDPENHAQDLQSRLGKLLRVKPTDPNAVWETVGYGLRNPWRFSFDRLTGDLWIGDLGAGRFEEIDYRPRALIGALVNYGWSRYEGPYLYNANVQLAPGGPLVRPAWFYAHSNGSPTNCGVIGGYVYRGSRVPAARGRYFFGDLCSGLIWSFKVAKGGRMSSATTVEGLVADLSSFGENTQGELYAVGLNGVLAVLR